MKTTIFILFFLSINAIGLFAQTNQTDKTTDQNNYSQADHLQNISQEITKISKSVQNFNNGIKELLEKLIVGRGMQLTERQQKLLLGFEVLNRAEQRVEILQKFQIELTQAKGRRS